MKKITSLVLALALVLMMVPCQMLATAEAAYPTAYVVKNDAPVTNENGDALEVFYSFDAFNCEIDPTLTDVNGVAECDMDLAQKLMDAAVSMDSPEAFAADLDTMQAAGVLSDVEVSRAVLLMQAAAPYLSWNCDFVVSFDYPVKAGSLSLSGCFPYGRSSDKYNYDYSAGQWYTFDLDRDLEAGEEYRLLYDYSNGAVTLNYGEILAFRSFDCGAVNYSEENYGTTMTVKLRMYEASGRYDTPDGETTVIGTYKYTFGTDLVIGTQRKGSDARLLVKLDESEPRVLSYDEVGFKLNVDGEEMTVSTDSAYDSFYNEYNLVQTGNLACHYVVILEVGNLTQAQNITAQAYYKIGTKTVWGKQKTLSAARIYSAWH
ncbi:MAG: hypothetical protein MJ132_01140 [Clostridia bacterium]|nr:hypothetical protein [Clostridia bacterium]